jgi:hypothetical protein
MSQILLKESNGRIYEVSAMRSGLAKIIENTSISRKFETTKTNVQMAENACCIDYSATRSSIRVHWLSTIQIVHCRLTYYKCEKTLEFATGVVWASEKIRDIYMWVVLESIIQWLLATVHNTESLVHFQIYNARLKAILIQDVVDVEEAYC